MCSAASKSTISPMAVSCFRQTTESTSVEFVATAGTISRLTRITLMYFVNFIFVSQVRLSTGITQPRAIQQFREHNRKIPRLRIDIIVKKKKRFGYNKIMIKYNIWALFQRHSHDMSVCLVKTAGANKLIEDNRNFKQFSLKNLPLSKPKLGEQNLRGLRLQEEQQDYRPSF